MRKSEVNYHEGFRRIKARGIVLVSFLLAPLVLFSAYLFGRLQVKLPLDVSVALAFALITLLMSLFITASQVASLLGNAGQLAVSSHCFLADLGNCLRRDMTRYLDSYGRYFDDRCRTIELVQRQCPPHWSVRDFGDVMSRLDAVGDGAFREQFHIVMGLLRKLSCGFDNHTRLVMTLMDRTELMQGVDEAYRMKNPKAYEAICLSANALCGIHHQVMDASDRLLDHIGRVMKNENTGGLSRMKSRVLPFFRKVCQ